jgi:hypothetical protein
VLKKSFKYFDLNGNGTVEPDEFAKAVEKIGIMIPTKQVSFSTKLSNHRVINFINNGVSILKLCLVKTCELQLSNFALIFN